MTLQKKTSHLSVEVLEQVIDTNSTGIIIVDSNNNIVLWNQWLEKTSFIKKEHALSKNLFTLFPELANSRIHKAVDLSFSKGNASFISHAFNKNPFPLYSNGDKNKPLRQLLHIKRIKSKNNKPYCFIQITDSSNAVYREKQLRNMANEAESISKLKSGFVSSVSHELRTPLTSIMGSLGLLKSNIEDPNSEISKNMLDIAYNNSERLLLLINDILDIEKIESGKMEFNFAKENINDLIKDCIKQNNGLAKKYQVNFNFTAAPELPLISMDKDRIFQALNNLMSNAAKFEPNGGTIEIESKLKNNKVYISITDHGSGIPDEFHDRIFQAFTQADTSNTKGVAGTGLGLSISKTIIEHHNGEINFDSIQNESTCFYFTLPI